MGKTAPPPGGKKTHRRHKRHTEASGGFSADLLRKIRGFCADGALLQTGQTLAQVGVPAPKLTVFVPSPAESLQQSVPLRLHFRELHLQFPAARAVSASGDAQPRAAAPSMAARTALLRAALGSVADRAIIPMYDWLGLGAEAHLNTPGKLGGNWAWRAKAGFDSKALAAQIEAECAVYCRCNADVQNVKESAI